MLATFLRREDEAAGDVSQSPWARAALEDGIVADEGYGPAPIL